MQRPEAPFDEQARLEALYALGLLDTVPEERFDRLTRLASQVFNVPIALVSLVDETRQWFKSSQGVSACETGRDISFCGHTILGDDLFIVSNALQDRRFADNPLVTGEPNIRFYAGAPLHSVEGYRLGTLCLIDSQPRTLSPEECSMLRDLADCVERELNLLAEKKLNALLIDSERRHKTVLQSLPDAVFVLDAAGVFLDSNEHTDLLVPREQLIGERLESVFAEGLAQRCRQAMAHVLQSSEAQQFQCELNLVKGVEYFEARVRRLGDNEILLVLRNITSELADKAALQDSQRMTEVIAAAQSRFIRAQDRRKAFDGLLNDILMLTGSQYGFIGEVLYHSDGAPYLKTYAITNIAWNTDTQAFYEAQAPQGMEFTNLNTLFGAALRTGEPVIANNPCHDPRRGGLPDGHPALDAFLGLPIYHNEELVAMLGLANRPDGYNQHVIEYLHPLMITLGQLVEAARVKRDQQEGERRLAAIIEATHVGTWEWNVQTGEAVFNERWAEIIGYTLEELSPVSINTWTESVHPDDGAVSEQALENHFSGELDYYDVQCRMRHKNGHWVWVHDRGRVVSWTADGQPEWMYGTHTDITSQKQDELALQQNEARLRGLFELSPVGIALNEYETGAFIELNDALLRPTGYTREEFVQLSYLDVTPEKYQEQELLQLESLERTGRYGPYEKEYIRKDGSRYPVLLNGMLVHDPNGRKLIWSMIEDISERTAMLRALEEERDLFSSGPVFTIIWEASEHWPVLYVSDNIGEILGYGKHEMCGPDFRYAALIHPDDMPRVTEEVSFNIANHIDTYEQSYRLRLKDGSYHWFYDFTKLIRNAAGEVVTIRGYMFDQSHLKQVEMELKEQAEHTQTLIDNIVDGVITIDSAGLIQSFNPAAESIFGYSSHEVQGRNVNILMPSPHREAHDGYLRNYRATGIRSIIGAGREVEGQRSDGSLFPMDLAVSELQRSGQTLYVGMVRDITERKRIERMKSEFVSTVSHELRTPLTSISGALGLIAGGALGELPEQAQQMINIAHKNSQRLAHLINDLLDMEKIVAGKLRFDMKCQPLGPLLHQSVEANRPFAQDRQVTLKLEDAVTEIQVYIDGQRLLQVLANLLSNAIKFSPAGETVLLNVQLSTGLVRVTVRDNGPGIPQDFRSRIFQKFSQADASDTRAKGGTGLGLAISRELVERMGGVIGFDSVEGEGASFWLELPIFRPGQLMDPIPQGLLTAPRILVVEDTRDVAEVLRMLLERAGYRVDLVNSGEQALAAMQNCQYAAITLDLMIPDINGLEIVRRLRQRAETLHLPIIVVSARMEEGRLAMSGDFSDIEWLAKPIDDQQLLSVVERVIEQARLAKPRILHVEDDLDLHQVVCRMVGGRFEFEQATTLEEARSLIALEYFDLVILDIGLPDGSGWELLAEIRTRQPDARIIILSGVEVSPEQARQVEHVLLKSQVSAQQLLDVLQHRIGTTWKKDLNHD